MLFRSLWDPFFLLDAYWASFGCASFLELFLAQLRHGDLAVDRAGRHQCVMRAESGNFAAVEHEDLIGITDGADALGDDDLRRAGKLLRKPLAERRVGLIVQRGERIVENQNFRRSCQRPRDGKPLLLPAGDVPAKLDRKSTRLNSSHRSQSRMPSSA